jgi:hypothetical protein
MHTPGMPATTVPEAELSGRASVSWRTVPGRTQRKPPGLGALCGSLSGRWRSFTYDELMARDKVNLDIFWLRDESLEDSANLPSPDVLALEIVEDLKAALSQFESIEEELSPEE